MSPAQEKLYYGWVMVGIAALQVFFSGPGQTYSISNWKKSYTTEFGWSQNTISFLYATATTTSACIMPFVGRAVDKYGQRRMSLIVSIGLVGACTLSSLVSSSGICWLSFFLLRFFGQGSMSLIPSTVIPYWFDRRRGRAFSYIAIGSFVSAVGFPLLDTWLIRVLGWRVAWLTIAAFIALVFVPTAFILYRDRPEEVNEVCEGHAEAARAALESQQNIQQHGLEHENAKIELAREANWTLAGIMKTRAFWALMHCNLERAAVNTAITFFIRDIGADIGISELQAASLLSIQAFVGFPVTLGVGCLLERMAVHHALATTFFVQAIALIVLINARSMFSCIVFSVIWGVGSGFEQISLQFVWPQYYGKGCLGAVNGSSMTSAVLGSALGPMIWGYAYDHNGQNWSKILGMTIPWALATGAFTWIFARKPAFREEDNYQEREGGGGGSGGAQEVQYTAVSNPSLAIEFEHDDEDATGVSAGMSEEQELSFEMPARFGSSEPNTA